MLRCFLIAWAAVTLAAQTAPEIRLRPDLPAGEEWYTPPSTNEHVKSPSEKWVRKVKSPVMEVYPAKNPNGTAVVVAPGGGFSILAIEHEGRDVAKWLNGRGVTAFVLRYRVGLESGNPPAMDRKLSRDAAVEDGLLAIKTVRERAKEWSLAPNKIGVMGFSAGGYLTIGAATQYDKTSRPDFAISIYAVSPADYQVPEDAPPIFAAVAYDDNERMTSTATAIVDKWKKVKRPAELHVFADGGHGFGMNKKGKSCDVWTTMLEQWLQRNAWIAGAK
jgi:acetyl esterase/lipase